APNTAYTSTVQRTMSCACLRSVVSLKSFRRGGGKMDALVLIVDDHVETREGYAAYLKFLGARVVTAAGGAQAIDLARELAPDVVVMDMRMPGMSGTEAIR